VTVQQFKVFRAIGLAFKAWFANFVPLTLFAALLYAPALYFAATAESSGELVTQLNAFQHVMWAVGAGSALVAPMITYRVIQYMNGTSTSIGTSIKYGVRGIAPVIIVAIVIGALNMIPNIGGLIGAIVMCFWFVAGPAAVVERLGPFAAIGRSATLTQGRRGGIFGLNFLIGLIVLAVVFVFLLPLFSSHADGAEMRRALITVTPIICVFQLFQGVVQAVSYSLLRADKDGVSNDELAKVFE
jgi:hypothetical protein